MNQTIKKRIHLILRMTVSAAILVFLFSRIDMKTLWMHIRTANIFLLVLALALDFLEQFIMVCQIFVVLRTRGIPLRLWTLYKIVFSTSFVGKFLPSSLGLDTLRMVGLARATKNTVKSISSILILRILGVVSILIMASISLLSGGYMQESAETLLVLGFLAAIMGILILGYSKRVRKYLGDWMRRLGLPEKPVRFVGNVAHSFYEFQGHKWTLGLLFLLCMLFQANRVFINYVVAVALGVRIPLGYFFLFIPLVLALSMLPFAIGGLGIREGGKVFFMTRMGATAAEAMGVSLIVVMTNLIIGLPGAVVYFLEGIGGKQKPAAAELEEKSA